MTPEPSPPPTSICTTAGPRALATCSTLDCEPGSLAGATVGVVEFALDELPCVHTTAPTAPSSAATRPTASHVPLRERGRPGPGTAAGWSAGGSSPPAAGWAIR